MSNLPKDGATVRLHKLNHLVEHCAAFGTRGCTEAQLLKEGQLQGNTSAKVLEYITLLNTWGLITRSAERYYVNELNYREWSEAKGFRERVYFLKCPNPECEASYGSKATECPSCHTPNLLISGEAKGYTHIAINSIKDKTLEKANNLDTHTHTKISPPRQNRAQEGKKAEKKAVKFLSQFGEARLGSGQNGLPDVLFTSSRAGYAVEVKSVEHQVRSGVDRWKASAVLLTVKQWVGLCLFAVGEGRVPLLLVEVRVRGSSRGSLYHFVPREVVDAKVAGCSGKNLRISVHDLAAMSIQTIRVGLPLVGGFRL